MNKHRGLLDIFGNSYSKYLPAIMVIFSIPSFIIFYKYGDTFYIKDGNLYLRIMCLLNILFILVLSILNIKTSDAKIRRNKDRIIITSVYFVIVSIMNIDVYFFDLKLNPFYLLINAINFLVYFGILSIFPRGRNLSRMECGIVGMVFTMLYNILFTILLKKMKHKNENIDNIIATLYYLQNTTCLVFLFYANLFIAAA